MNAMYLDNAFFENPYYKWILFNELHFDSKYLLTLILETHNHNETRTNKRFVD